jgi:adenosylmethionine-8-amino-7-oxononanoate aminotransferase
MNSAVNQLPGFLKQEGLWSNVFSYHPSEVEIASARGIYITDRSGTSYIDASGGPMAINLPHGHPRITAAITAQLEKYSYCHPLFADRQRAELCNSIAEIAPGDVNATYLVSGGSEAVETALKLARQYHVLTGNVEKHKIVSLFESYHGMTLAAMSLAGNPNYKRVFDPMMPAWPHITQYSDYERPAGTEADEWCRRCAAELEKAIEREGKEPSRPSSPHQSVLDQNMGSSHLKAIGRRSVGFVVRTISC